MVTPVRLKWRKPLSVSSLRSVNGKHAPFVRPRCGFNSCRRLCSLLEIYFDVAMSFWPAGKARIGICI